MARFWLIALAAEVSAQLGVTEILPYNCFSTDNLDTCFPNGTDVSVATTNGTIIGKIGTDSIARFYGVEFADSTGTGANGPRFKYPKPLGTWTTPKQAKQIKRCDLYEDCLSLQIATPSLDTSGTVVGALLPTFVYFTGGGFMSVGNAPDNIMDKAYHAKYGIDVNDPSSPGKAILVYINYRLAMLGWMSHPGFGLGNGNFGLADGIEGLKWVKSNIASFGGDSNKVTIQGASAGGGYVSMILASPLSVGLINSVFSMSPYVSYHPAAYSQTWRKDIGMIYMYASQCSTGFDVPTSTAEIQSQVDCLTNKDLTTLWPDWGLPNGTSAGSNAVTFAAGSWLGMSTDPRADFTAAKNIMYGGLQQDAGFIMTYNFAVHPVVDGYVMDMDPISAYESGRNSDVTVIMGHQANEYSAPLFSMNGTLEALSNINIQWQIGIKDLPVTASLEDMILAIAAAPNVHEVTAAAYPGFGSPRVSEMPASAWQTNIQSYTDVFFTWGIDSATKAMRKGGFAKTYRLLNLVGAPDSLQAMLAAFGMNFKQITGAYHAAEDNLNMGNYLWADSFLGETFAPYGITPGSVTFSTQEIAAATAMNTHFKNVIMGNDPDASGVAWPANSDSVMVYGTYFNVGAAFAPCIRIHASAMGCVTETTAPFRGSQVAYFNDPTTYLPPTTPPSASCSVPYLNEAGGASGTVSGSFGLTLTTDLRGTEYQCSTCSCQARRKQQLLFGVGSFTTPSCSCA